MASWERILTEASSIKDLSDVYDSMSPSDGQVLTFDTTNGWQAETPSSGGVGVSGSPVDNQVAVFTNSSTIEGDNNFTWDGSKLNVEGPVICHEVKLRATGTLSFGGEHGDGSRVLGKVGSNTSVTAGQVYYLGSSGWSNTDADAGSSSSGLIAVATDTSSQNGMLVDGIVRLSSNSEFSSANTGDILYLSTEPGKLQASRPSGTGDIVRVVGYVVSAANAIVYFSPSKDWIELS